MVEELYSVIFAYALNQGALTQEVHRPSDDPKIRPEETMTCELINKESPLNLEILAVNNFSEDGDIGKRHEGRFKP